MGWRLLGQILQEDFAVAAKAITAAESVLPGKKGIEIILPEPIPLVASPSATTSIKTHFFERTFASPNSNASHVDDAGLAPARAAELYSTLSCIGAFTRIRPQWRTDSKCLQNRPFCSRRLQASRSST